MEAEGQRGGWTPGTAVGAYALVRPLARGGMGEVWLARDTASAGGPRLVAIKRIVAGGETDATLRTMFLDEARIAAQLQHANIVRVFELGQLGESYYLVMEYLRGHSLARVARRLSEQQGRVPVQVAVQIVADAARGLGYAHRKLGPDGQPWGVVHRDVSPQNLLVGYDGQTKVLDFGIAKAAGRLTKTQAGVMRGRLAYMAPEQAKGAGVTAASDVFSLAVILYELLSGARLYGQADDAAIFRALSAGTVPLPITDYPGVDAALGAIVMRALSPDPRQRPADGAVLAEALLGWQRAHPGPPGQRVDAIMREAFARELAEDLAPPPAAAAVAPPAPSREASGSAAAPVRRRTAALVIAGALGVLAVAGALRSTSGKQPERPPTALATPPTAAPPSALVPAPAAPAGPAAPPPAPAAPPPPAAAPAVVATPEVVAPAPRPGARPLASKPPSPRADAAAAKPGTLSLDTDPWSQVFLGKKLLGDTPLLDVPVPAGRHVLRLVNAEHGIDTTVEVTITSDQRTVKRLAL